MVGGYWYAYSLSEAWALGQTEAGSWGRDEIRNITGGFSFSIAESSTTYGAFSSIKNNPFALGTNASEYSYYNNIFNASLNVPTGSQNVPQHVWQPVIIYLGRPR